MLTCAHNAGCAYNTHTLAPPFATWFVPLATTALAGLWVNSSYRQQRMPGLWVLMMLALLELHSGGNTLQRLWVLQRCALPDLLWVVITVTITPSFMTGRS